MLKICICDDEKEFCQNIHKQLDVYAMHNNQDYRIMECHDANQLLGDEPQYDVLFLDIRFDKSNIGVQIAEKLRAQDNRAFIIFVTSLPGHYPGCFEVEAFRYLLKPITDETVSDTMNAVHQKMERESSGYRKVLLSTFNGNDVIDTRQLVTIESDAITRRRTLWILDKPPIETRLSLKEIAGKLEQQRFVYTHQSYIVNLEYVEQIVASKIVLRNGATVPVGRAYKDGFLIALERYIGDKL